MEQHGRRFRSGAQYWSVRLYVVAGFVCGILVPLGAHLFYIFHRVDLLDLDLLTVRLSLLSLPLLITASYTVQSYRRPYRELLAVALGVAFVFLGQVVSLAMLNVLAFVFALFNLPGYKLF